MPRKQDLTFYLLKAGIADFEACLTRPGELTRYNLPAASGIAGSLFTRAPGQSNPWWVDFMRQAVPEVPEMRNMSTAAALFLTVDGHRLAITFGYGRNLLELDCLVRDFGLKVALNTIHPDTLRSVDARTFEELSVAKKTQTSRPTGLETFSLNRSEEILKAVTGAPREEAFGHRITGADAVIRQPATNGECMTPSYAKSHGMVRYMFSRAAAGTESNRHSPIVSPQTLPRM